MALVEEKSFRLGVAILAAGRSRRMGQPKLLLPWGNTSVLGHLLAAWQRLGAQQIAVVCASGDTSLKAEAGRLHLPPENLIFNPNPDLGMFSSVQCASRWPGWNPTLNRWAIVLGDQPHLSAETLLRACEFTAARPADICQPSRNGRPRHPVFLPKPEFLEFATTSAQNLKEFLRDRTVALCEIDDPGLDLDLDTPEDYRRAFEVAETNRPPSGREGGC